MMKRKQAYKIVHYYFIKLKKYARLFQKEFDEEAFHQFRVNIKKLRAFLRMMRLMAEKPGELKFPHRFKKMYALTGKIRDRQLYLERVNEKKPTYPASKIVALQKEINELKKRKDKLLSQKELTVIEMHIKNNLPTDVGAGLIKNFFAHKLAAIQEIISKNNYKDSKFHDIRKALKDILYIIRIFQNDLKIPLPFPFWSKPELKNAERLSHNLGLFNDAGIALSFVRSPDVKKAGQKEKVLLSAIRKKWMAEKRKLKKDILRDLTNTRWLL